MLCVCCFFEARLDDLNVVVVEQNGSGIQPSTAELQDFSTKMLKGINASQVFHIPRSLSYPHKISHILDVNTPRASVNVMHHRILWLNPGISMYSNL